MKEADMSGLRPRWISLLCAAAICAFPATSSLARWTPFDGVVSIPPVPAPTSPGDIVGVILKNQTENALHDQPVTFGEVFVAGKVHVGDALMARVNGNNLPAQMDVKTTNPDGSVRMAVVTVIMPDLPAGEEVPVMLAQGQRASGAEVSPTLPSAYNVAVDLAMQGGQTYHFAPAELLKEALAKKTVSYWLRGPLATEVRVDKPVLGSLHVTFDIRIYADAKTLTDVQFLNDYALRRVGGAVTYDVNIIDNGKSAFSQQNVKQPQYTTWHKLVGTGGPDSVQVIHDIAALERSNAILDYDLSAGVNRVTIMKNTAAMNGDGYGILENAGLARYMEGPGGRPDIGPTTGANTIWLVTQDFDAQKYALVQADAAGSVPWHFYDPEHGGYPTATRYPDLWIDDRAAGEKLHGLTQQIPHWTKDCECFFLDSSHQPDLSFVPYILTGEHYYLDQLEAQSTWTVMSWDPRKRSFDKGIVFPQFIQARGMAWTFRQIINAAWIVPDADPLKGYFKKLQANNIEYVLKEIRGLHEGEASGWIPANGFGAKSGEIVPWQQDFIAYVMILAAKRGDLGALDILKWQTNFLAGRFLAQSQGFSPYDGAAYRMIAYRPNQMIDGAYQTWAEIEQATTPKGFTNGSDTWPKRTWPGYIQSAKGVLASIVRLTGSDKARQAYEWLDQNAPQAGLAKDRMDPTWRVVP
ncbi:MAG: hypothetical protein ACTHLR_00725 [Rhizomicrobium sp.]